MVLVGKITTMMDADPFAAENIFSGTDNVTTESQMKEFDEALISKQTCTVCSMSKRLSDFPMGFTFRKLSICSVCSLLKKRGFKCMVETDKTADHTGLEERTPLSPPVPSRSSLPSPKGIKSFVKRLSFSGPSTEAPIRSSSFDGSENASRSSEELESSQELKTSGLSPFLRRGSLPSPTRPKSLMKRNSEPFIPPREMILQAPGAQYV